MAEATTEWVKPPLPFTPKQVAEMYGLGIAVIYKEISDGRLKARKKKGCTKSWYITREALDEWAGGGMLE